MIQQAIDRILELAVPTLFDINGCNYSSRQLHKVEDPLPDLLEVNTLTGLIDYLNANIDRLERDKLFIHIEDPIGVNLCMPMTEGFRRRPVVLLSKAKFPKFSPGYFYPHYEFMIVLQMHFVRTEVIDKLLQLFGNISNEQVRTSTDDGVTQQIVARQGLKLLDWQTVPNPVFLQPYRTFPEVEQPASPFIIRLKEKAEKPAIAFFEADGGAWEIDAIHAIRDWLRERVDIPIIA